tara:strand:+ start:502 stop:894 length:393 start_codon:yes stop_codon:yes gene_type:complete
MNLLYLLSFVALVGCSTRDCNPGTSTEEFAGTNLLLDKYMTDKCFRLVDCGGESCVQTVYTYKESDLWMTDEEWSWTYEPPNLYIVEDFELDVYHSINKDECWDLEAFALDLKAEACPCPYTPVNDSYFP